ncbi:peptidoglycan editing factor PgeF [Phenylobacterium terrae]|uniref:Purine nucleoside phosphorylase n=1 Tax=Phenylobacterium terrae TaxID=2665495 RepID=A0ABW4N3T4_9CAUL
MTLSPITSPLLNLPGVRHAFFTRQGGVSKGIYESLNVGLGSSDDPADVAENRRRAAEHFALPSEALSTCYQIHSANALIAEHAFGDMRPEGDAVVTRARGVICGALAADCAPILMADPQAGVVAAAHAGWRGALAGIAEAAVARMVELGAEPGRIVAAVGPCIGPASYEVGLDFLTSFTAKDAGYEVFFRPGAGPDKRLFDLPSFVLSRLRAAGVTTCAWTGHDTVPDEERFFSNRRAFKRGEPDFGRLLSAIALT